MSLRRSAATRGVTKTTALADLLPRSRRINVPLVELCGTIGVFYYLVDSSFVRVSSTAVACGWNDILSWFLFCFDVRMDVGHGFNSCSKLHRQRQSFIAIDPAQKFRLFFALGSLLDTVIRSTSASIAAPSVTSSRLSSGSQITGRRSLCPDMLEGIPDQGRSSYVFIASST